MKNKEKLIIEHKKLRNKIAKLSIFIESEKFKLIVLEEQKLIKIQLTAMKIYSMILEKRMKL